MFDYSANKITGVSMNMGTDSYVYLCAINTANNTVVPIFKMNTTTALRRKEAIQRDVYTTYIVK